MKSDLVKAIDPLKYQQRPQPASSGANELLTVKFRYKDPDEQTSKLITGVVKDHVKKPSDNLNWAMAAAGFGMLLRDSMYKGDLTYQKVLALAGSAKSTDKFGYRREFIELVSLARDMSPEP